MTVLGVGVGFGVLGTRVRARLIATSDAASSVLRMSIISEPGGRTLLPALYESRRADATLGIIVAVIVAVEVSNSGIGEARGVVCTLDEVM